MPVLKLHFDIYHLAVYLAAILFWSCFCLLLALLPLGVGVPALAIWSVRLRLSR